MKDRHRYIAVVAGLVAWIGSNLVTNNVALGVGPALTAGALAWLIFKPRGVR